MNSLQCVDRMKARASGSVIIRLEKEKVCFTSFNMIPDVVIKMCLSKFSGSNPKSHPSERDSKNISETSVSKSRNSNKQSIMEKQVSISHILHQTNNITC